MKRLLFTTIMTLITMFTLSSCQENENYKDYKPVQGSMFVCVESYEDPYLGAVKILVDRETRIMYMYAIKDYAEQESACVTVLYDSKGQPKKYSGVVTE